MKVKLIEIELIKNPDVVEEPFQDFIVQYKEPRQSYSCCTTHDTLDEARQGAKRNLGQGKMVRMLQVIDDI